MKNSPLVIILAICIVVITGCSPSPTPLPTPDARATEVRIAASIYATLTASVPTPSKTPTNTPAPSNTPTSMLTPTPTIDATRMMQSLFATLTAIPTLTNTPKPSETPTSTPTSVPTNTPAPSITPTVTSVPSATPVPSITPSPTRDFTTSEQEYAASCAKIGNDYSFAMQGLSGLTRGVSTNTSLLLDRQWRADVALVLAVVKKLANDVRGLTPPPRFVAPHTDLLDAASHWDAFVNYFADGIDQLDNAKLLRAGQELDLADSALDRATAKVKELNKK